MYNITGRQRRRIREIGRSLDCFCVARPYTVSLRAEGLQTASGGDMASTWVAKLWVHAEGQITS